MPKWMWIAAAAVAGALLYGGHEAIAGLLFVTAIILNQLHVIEVKLNKLLDDRNLTVSRKEIEDAW
jgi:hypothetical protein